MIIQITSLFLMFLTEAETYFCLKNMVETSKQFLNEVNTTDLSGIKSMRWHITLEAGDFAMMCSSFFHVVEEKSFFFNEILEFFSKNNLNYSEMFENWIKDLFINCFPLSVSY